MTHVAWTPDRLQQWFEPWRLTDESWLADTWGLQWQVKFAPSVIASRLSYAAWCHRWSWAVLPPAAPDGLWLSFFGADIEDLQRAAVLMDLVLNIAPNWAGRLQPILPQDLRAVGQVPTSQNIQDLRWAYGYRSLQGQGLPSSRVSSALTVMANMEVTVPWGRVALRLPKPDVEDGLASSEVEGAALRALAAAALRHVVAVQRHAGEHNVDS
ncbi:hypothetical protein [Chitinivorax sp. B]|uniref:hypothetical protein n=1 Tax=Chitinivorax sp. B TaxID=2502235 RepID=UPI0010F4A3AA|nr:hypothetical protein [Chitinivorax sp. B]